MLWPPFHAPAHNRAATKPNFHGQINGHWATHSYSFPISTYFCYLDIDGCSAVETSKYHCSFGSQYSSTSMKVILLNTWQRIARSWYLRHYMLYRKFWEINHLHYCYQVHSKPQKATHIYTGFHVRCFKNSRTSACSLHMGFSLKFILKQCLTCNIGLKTSSYKG